ncbi:MAG: ATP synthase delta/epsilon chain alpha-helix domain-containing protein [Turicibacter sp.]|nr:ATP synthase delta/epsilon chain alpha-helix domain-containing protein [Turicibacter sp.]
MGKSIKLNIVAPGREVLTEEIVSLATTEGDGKIEFLANYAPTIIATIPTITTYTTIDGDKKKLFTSSGIVYIKDNIINFCCDSFNLPEEIDRDRAEQSLKRAQERLNNKEKNNIDIERAKRAEARAKARLELK